MAVDSIVIYLHIELIYDMFHDIICYKKHPWICNCVNIGICKSNDIVDHMHNGDQQLCCYNGHGWST